MTFRPTEAQKSYWRKVRAAFDPWQRSTPEEVDKLYAERPASPSDKLARDFDLLADHQHLRVVLCGARGSGKSTELARLEALTRERFAVLRLDLEGALPHGTGALALITIINALVEAGLRVWSHPDAEALTTAEPAPASSDKVMRQLKIASDRFAEVVQAAIPWLQMIQGTGSVPDGTAETAQAVSAGMSGLSRLIARMVADSDALRAGAHPQHRAEADALIRATNQRLADFRESAGKPALFLLDGLDRSLELDAIKALFHDVDVLRSLDVSLVLCGPIAVRHATALRGVAHDIQPLMLENVPITHREASRTPDERGLRLMREVFERRCAAWGLETAVAEPGAVKRAALLSAGLMRDFLDLLWRASAKAAYDPGQCISEALVEDAIGERRREMQGYLTSELNDLLFQVLKTRELPPDPRAAELLFENFIACYSNGDVWFRPHELLVEWLERRRSEDDERRGARAASDVGGE